MWITTCCRTITPTNEIDAAPDTFPPLTMLKSPEIHTIVNHDSAPHLPSSPLQAGVGNRLTSGGIGEARQHLSRGYLWMGTYPHLGGAPFPALPPTSQCPCAPCCLPIAAARSPPPADCIRILPAQTPRNLCQQPFAVPRSSPLWAQPGSVLTRCAPCWTPGST
jgi:hypothetical protein